jgi:hypothetical protein
MQRRLLFLILSAFQCLAQTSFQNIFMGRCYDRTLNHPYFKQLAQTQNLTFDCTAIWNAVQLGNTTNDFSQYFALTDHPIPRDLALFWTGADFVQFSSPALPSYAGNTRDTVHYVSRNGLRFWTLEDTLWGYLMNGLTGYTGRFWTNASAFFAQHATGDVQMLAYASTDTRSGTVRAPYRPTDQVIEINNGTMNYTIYSSIFANTEIYNLQPQNVTSFTVWILVNPLYPGESCSRGSVALMENDLQNLEGGPHFLPEQLKCVNTPDITKFALCMDSAPFVDCRWYEPNSMNAHAVGAGVAIGVGASLLPLIGLAVKAFRKSGTNVN